MVLLICSIGFILSLNIFAYGEEQQWQGKFFPELHDDKHGIKMGVSHKDCDDAKHFIENDYDGSIIEYSCFENRNMYLPDPTVNPILVKENIPESYTSQHYCINHTITYDRPLPTFGPHRPLWAKYGEYSYAPPQRWLHNLEHGGIVMVHHPCADPNEVYALKQIVKRCLYRHLITASRELSRERPLGLIAWGYRLTMSKLDTTLVVDFLRTRTNKGAEKTSRNGKYMFELIAESEIVSDKYDSDVCPGFPKR